MCASLIVRCVVIGKSILGAPLAVGPFPRSWHGNEPRLVEDFYHVVIGEYAMLYEASRLVAHSLNRQVFVNVVEQQRTEPTEYS
jgi:hypothetical protein